MEHTENENKAAGAPSGLNVGLAAAYERDAERYAWLKNNPDSPQSPYYNHDNNNGNGIWIIPYEVSGAGGLGGGVGGKRYYSLDDAVDAAMAANVQAQGLGAALSRCVPWSAVLDRMCAIYDFVDTFLQPVERRKSLRESLQLA